MNGRPREYLPCKEREEYILYVRAAGFALKTECQRNRHINDFVRLAQSMSSRWTVRDVDTDDVLRYAKHIKRTSKNVGTARVKLNLVINWLRWLKQTERI